MDSQQIKVSTERWLKEVVIGYNLCPFAQRELQRQSIRFVVSNADNEIDLLQALEAELDVLLNDQNIETCLLIHPSVLGEFHQYNQFLDAADALLDELGLVGEIQIASFHPDYQFANTLANDAENFTNRSPYPMLHLLRETSLERAIASHPDASAIPDQNIKRMNEIGSNNLERELRSLLGK